MAAISIHALLAESDARLAAFAQHGAEDFYPRSPCGERRYSLRPPPARGEISIHALLAESDHARVGVAAGAVISIHALLAESDVLRQGLGSWSSYFYPRSPCGERQQFGRLCFQRQPISIHALLAESDYLSNNSRHFLRPFLSTLSLRRATQTNTGSNESGEFLSTLSLRRATIIFRCVCQGLKYFYPRSPCGERLYMYMIKHINYIFLSTLSLRRATRAVSPFSYRSLNFYPRSPCGERRMPL